MNDLPPRCIHRKIPDLPHITHELASPGMRVLYSRPGMRQAEPGVIQLVEECTARVLFLGDRVDKLCELNDLTYWPGPEMERWG